jgi:hypothetical protein
MSVRDFKQINMAQLSTGNGIRYFTEKKWEFEKTEALVEQPVCPVLRLVDEKIGHPQKIRGFIF